MAERGRTPLRRDGCGSPRMRRSVMRPLLLRVATTTTATTILTPPRGRFLAGEAERLWWCLYGRLKPEKLRRGRAPYTDLSPSPPFGRKGKVLRGTADFLIHRDNWRPRPFENGALGEMPRAR